MITKDLLTALAIGLAGGVAIGFWIASRWPHVALVVNEFVDAHLIEILLVIALVVGALLWFAR